MLTVLGSRGASGQYGGFETMVSQIARVGSLNGITCDSVETFFEKGRPFQIMRPRTHLHRFLSTNCDCWRIRNTASAVLLVNSINVMSGLLLTLLKKKVLLHMDGMEDQRRKWGFVAKRVHRVARYVAVKSSLQLVTDSRAIQEWYREKYGRETIFIPYGGCEIAEADGGHRWNPSGDRDFYMVLARPEPENQIFEICRAFLKSKSTCRLVVVGAPREPTKYWKKVQRLVGDSPRVHLAGSIYDRDRRCEMYVNTRGVIHGHTVGGTNPSLVDALSHGCPVLPHGNPYNREVAGETGVYWNSEKELVAILNDADRVYPRVNADGFIKRYNWNDVANAYFTVLGLIPKEETKQ